MEGSRQANYALLFRDAYTRGFVKSKEVTEEVERFGGGFRLLEMLYFLLWAGFCCIISDCTLYFR